MCRGTTGRGFALCRPCAVHARELPHRADLVVPVSYAPRGGELARALSGYKTPGAPLAHGERVRTLLSRFLRRHEPCLAAALGVAAIPAFTVVPSGRGRVPHPLWSLLRDGEPRLREFGPVPGPMVLLDDLWTTGSHAQLAAAALKRAGTPRVAIVVVGRFLAVPPPAALPWSADRCALRRCDLGDRGPSRGGAAAAAVAARYGVAAPDRAEPAARTAGPPPGWRRPR